MTNKLLITTALIAVSGLSNVYADIVINSDTVLARDYNDNLVICGGNVTNPNDDYHKVSIGSPNNGKNLTINGGTVTLDDSGFATYTGNTEISGASVINLNNDSDIKTNNLTVNGGTINLDKGSISGNNSFKMTDGAINAKGTSNIGSIGLDSEQIEDDVTSYAGGTVDILGGKINVEGGKAIGSSAVDIYDEGNILFGKTIRTNNAEINIKDGATLFAYENYSIDESDEDVDVITFGNKATINLSLNSIINLSGALSANINGNDSSIINFNNSNAVIDGNVESPSLTFNTDHSLSKAITGEIGSLDKLTIAKGTLNFDKELADTITTVEVASGATLDIGLNTLHSTGDKADGEGVIFKDNSTLKFTATSADTHGQIKANYINISENGTTLNMNFNGAALAKGESITIQLFDQSKDEEGVDIEGQFATLSNNARYEFVADTDDNGKFNGKYIVTGIASASDVIDDNPSDDNPKEKNTGSLDNNQKTADAWDSLDTSKISNATTVAVAQKLAELSNNATTPEGKKAYIDALTALAPETAPAIQQVATETANQVFGAVGSRLSGGSVAGSRQGISSGDANGYNGAVWAQMLYNKSKYDKTANTKFDADTKGVAFGLEKYFNPAIKAGIGYAYNKTDIDGFMRDTDVKTHTAIVYGEYKPSNWFVNGIVTYGWSDYDEKKNVGGISVKADYDVEALAMQAMTGYDMNIKGYGVTPETGLRYVHIKNKAYKNSADERVKNDDSDIITGVIGARVNKTYAYNNVLLKPELKAAMTYDLANDDTKSVVTLVNGSSYAVQGKALNRFGVELGAGLTAEVRDNVELSLGYEGKFRKDYQDHTGLVNAKYKF
ncbi:MAG: autotransporter domain-containing protein [Alphaproteobacteria bacterium]|nr:autotransporter domain-containing protein [Alphaproteobacteria bacterium]